MGQTAQSLAHPLPKESRAGVSADGAGRVDRGRVAVHWALESLPWGYAAAFILGAAVVAAAAVYHMAENNGAVTTTGAILVAGLLVLLYGGLLAGWRRAGVLERKLQRMQVVLKLREYAEHMVESTPSGLVLLSPQRCVLAANRSFLEGLRLRSDEVVGRRLEEVDGAQELSSALAQILHRGTDRDELILQTATNIKADNRGLRVLLREVNSGDKFREGQLLMIVEGLGESELTSALAESPLTP